MSKLDELKKVKAEINRLKEEVAAKVKGVFEESVKELFNDNPALKSISWTAYTPYFNDGDACTFSSGHGWANINDFDSDYDEDDLDEEEKKAKEEWDNLSEKEQNSIEKAVSDFMSHWDDDDMYGMFGDHVKVIVTPKGIETEEYQHD